ncbi:hypothetical protein BDR26DRAFT_396545 [Obelidium mucronatum]|nr:hypothetical protein BDR26DRAFT_396545 [Obelidium mucronatum]
MGLEFIEFLSECLGRDMEPMQPVSVKIHALEIDAFCQESIETRDANILKFTDSWLRSLDVMMSRWNSTSSALNPELLNFFVSPLNSVLLSKLRPLCVREKLAMSNISKSCRLYIHLIQKSIIAEGARDAANLFNTQVDAVFELVACMYDLKSRKKASGFVMGGQSESYLAMNEIGVSLGDQMDAFQTHFKNLCDFEAAVLKHVMLSDLGIIMECVSCGVRGFDGRYIFLCLEHVLIPPEAEYLRHDWWVKLEASVLLELFEIDQRLGLLVPRNGINTSLVILKVIAKLLEKASIYNHFTLGIVWLRKSILVLNQHQNSLEWTKTVQRAIERIIAALIPRLDYEPDHEVRILIGEILKEYWTILARASCAMEFESLPILRRLKDVHPQVQQSYIEIISVCIDPLLATSAKQAVDGDSMSNRFKLSVMASANLGNFKWSHFLLVMTTLGICPALDVPKLDYTKTLMRVFHICQAASAINQAAGLLAKTELSAFSNAFLSEDLLVYWALWECARFCTLSRLRTPFGNPEQTFGAIEMALSANALTKGECKPMKYLIQFIEMLELQIHNTISGTSLNLPPAPKSSTVFFHANRHVCSEWFSRIRSRIVTASAFNNCHGYLVWNAQKGLGTLQNSKKLDAGSAESLKALVPCLVASFVSLREPDFVSGLSKWVEKRFTQEDINMDWVKGFVFLADNRFECGLKELEGVDWANLHWSLANTHMKHQAILNSSSILEKSFSGSKSRHLIAAEDTLQRWRELEQENAIQPNPYPISSLVSLALQTNTMKLLPNVSFQNTDFAAVVEKAPGTLQLLIREILSNVSVDNECTTKHGLRSLFQVKAMTSLKSLFMGKHSLSIHIPPKFSVLADSDCVPLFKSILSSHDPVKGSNELFELWLSARKRCRKLECFELANNISGVLQGDFSGGDDVVCLKDRIELARLEFSQTKSPEAIVKLIQVTKMICPDADSAELQLVQAKALVACFKQSVEINWIPADGEKSLILDLLGSRESSAVPEACLSAATNLAPSFEKPRLLLGNIWHKKGLDLVEELRQNRLVYFLESFEGLYRRLDSDDMTFGEFSNKLSLILLGVLGEVVTPDSDAIQMKIHASFGTLSDPVLADISSEIVRMKVTIIQQFACSTMNYFEYLRLQSNATKAKTQSAVALKLIRLLTLYGEDLDAEFEKGFEETPCPTWFGVVPQLFSCVSHPKAAVSNHAVNILCRIAAKSPNVLVYSFVVGSRSAKVLASPRLQELYQKIKTGLNAEYVEHIGLLLNELHRSAVLWEEIWFNKLSYLNGETPKRLQQVSAEISRVKANPTMKSTIGIDEKYQIIIFPVVNAIERLVKETFDTGATTPHEIWFQTAYLNRITSALATLKNPTDLTAPKKLWEPFSQIANDISKDFQKNRKLKLFDLSPNLQALSLLSIPIPASGKSVEVVTVDGFGEDALVLPTKTKPKKIELLASDGRRLPFLLKGLEDLRLDERVQQVMSTANSLLNTDKVARSRKFKCRTYDIFPLGDHFGIIQWVNNVQQLFSIYKRWQMKDHVVKNSLKESGEQMLRPHEMFNAKLSIALKKHGISKTASRREWPASVLTSVFRELCAETPDFLVRNELWCSSPSSSIWWEKTVSFSRSLGVNSILGYLIGLGDRHLDNIMVDLKEGELVHIDFNVCFEKGLRLRVPEKVPFRLTQNLVEAMGVGGLEGPFKVSCDLTLDVLQRNKDVLLALLESFVYDPIVDWAIDEETVADRVEQVNMNLKLLWSRIAENKDEIVNAVDLLPSQVSQIFRDMQSFVANTSNKALLQQEIESLTIEMRNIGTSSSKHISQRDETKAKDDIMRLLNESAMWHSKHQMSISVLMNPQLDTFLANLNLNSAISAEMLSSDASSETFEFDQRFLETIQSRESTLSQLFQRIKAYQSLILPVVNSLSGYDLRHRIVAELSTFRDDSNIGEIRQRLLSQQETSPPSKTIIETFNALEKSLKLKVEELGALKQSIDAFAISSNLVGDLSGQLADTKERFLERESYFAGIICCVVVQCVEGLGSGLFDLTKATVGNGFLSKEIRAMSTQASLFGCGCSFWTDLSCEAVATVVVIRDWMSLVKEFLGDEVSLSFEVDVLKPLNALVTFGYMMQEFGWQLVSAISNIFMILSPSPEHNVGVLVSQLEKICRPFLMVTDPKSHEFQQHALKLREEFDLLVANHGQSAAGAIISSIESVFGPLEAKVASLHTLMTDSKEDEALRNALFVQRIMMTLSLIDSCQKYIAAQNHQLGVWELHTIDVKSVISQDVNFREFVNQTTDYVSQSIRGVLLKPALKILNKMAPKKLVAEYLPGTASLFPAHKSSGQSLKNACSLFLAASLKAGIIDSVDLESVRKAFSGICLERLKQSIVEKARGNTARLEWSIGNQSLILNRYQYLFERHLYKTCTIKNIREEIILEFSNCVVLMETDMKRLKNCLAQLSCWDGVSPNVIQTRLGLVNEEIGKLSTALDLCQGLLDFELSRSPSPLKFAPVQHVLSLLTKLEILEVRKNPTKEGYTRILKSLSLKLGDISSVSSGSNSVAAAAAAATGNAQVLESMEGLLRCYDGAKGSLKRLHSALDRVVRSCFNIQQAHGIRKKLKVFWSHWPHLGAKQSS